MSAAGHAHVARQGRFALRGIEGMAQRLAREQAFERLVERGFATGAHDIAQFDLLVMAQAAIDRPGRGNTDAIAPGAEIVAERSDEPDPRARLCDVEVACGPAGAVERGDEREMVRGAFEANSFQN